MRDGLHRIRLIVVLLTLLALQPLPSAVAQERSRNTGDIDCSLDSTGLVPINDLGNGTHQGAEGGLYPGGSNEVPDNHAALGLWHASQITPLDSNGISDADGAIVLLSIGVSNTKQEFAAFSQLAAGLTAPDVALVNGSQSGEPIATWLSVDDSTWDAIDNKLARDDFTPAQVQAAWVMLPERIQSVDALETFPVDAEIYQADLTLVLRNAKDRYPNLRVAYLSSRIYGGYNTSGRPSPEPLAYQHGFGVKWTIEDQISGNPDLNADPRLGEVEAPWLAWGPYVWADGTTPRSDGLTWVCSDLQSDGTHPSARGAEKVGAMLLDHLLADPTASPWFAAGGEELGSIELPPLAAVTPSTTSIPSAPPTTVAAASPTESSPSTTEAAAPTRPGRPDRRPGASASSDSVSPELLLGGTVLALAAVLGLVTLAGRTRRREQSD